MEKETNKRKIYLIIIIFVVLLAVSGFGSLFSANPESDAWYNQVKSSITPPGYVFGIAWTILYILIGVSIYLSLKVEKKENKKIILFWIINLVTNALWTSFFFGIKNPVLAFIDLIIIWITCLMLIILNWKNNRTSAYLLIPYLLWLTFAGLLNILAI
jgi:tryptophan-rich sensory protein